MARYRGRAYGYHGGGPGVGRIFGIVAAVALAAAAVWLGLRFFAPEQEPPRTATVLTPAPTPSPTPEPAPTPRPAPPQVRGIYVSGPVAGDPYMEELIALLDRTELNAVVIDVKNDEGNVTYVPENGMAVELGACVRYIRDLPELVARLKEHGVYTIARISAFKDPVLAQARPELALHKADGSAVTEGGGLAWVNPYDREVWDYLAGIALGAAEAGFDEVQFDYVRFPTGKGTEEADYGPAAEGVSKEDAVADFLAYARDLLEPKGVWLSADVFGTVIKSGLDARLIGQDYARMAAAVDFICPMVYPSHYAPDTFGLAVPDAQPYETVLAALEGSKAALGGLEQPAGVRAWLQAFTATWVKGHVSYGAEEVQAQIKAVHDAGYSDYILWNAKNYYGGLFADDTE